VVYAPRDLFTGHDAFRFVAGDGRLDSASAQASVTVVRDRTRPRVAILSRRLTVRHGKVAVRLGCPRVERRGCRGRVSVGRIGSSAFRIRGGRRGLVRVRVHSAHAGHVTVKVRAVDRARNVGVTRRRVTLKL
jgi:hypothetical protein